MITTIGIRNRSMGPPWVAYLLYPLGRNRARQCDRRRSLCQDWLPSNGRRAVPAPSTSRAPEGVDYSGLLASRSKLSVRDVESASKHDQRSRLGRDQWPAPPSL